MHAAGSLKMGSSGANWVFLVLAVSLVVSASATSDDDELMIGGLNITYSCKKSNGSTVLDKELIEVALNLEYLEAEYFLWGSVGYGLDVEAKYLVDGGPPPIGVQKANLNPYYKDIFYQFGLQEVGHIR